MDHEFSISVPDTLVGKVDISEPYENYGVKGNLTSYGIDLELPDLHLTKSIKSKDIHILPGKIQDTLRAWEPRYQRHLEKQHKLRRSESVEDRNEDARRAVDELERILTHTLDIDDAVDWGAIKRKDSFRTDPEKLFDNGRPAAFMHFNSDGRPTGFKTAKPPSEPTLEKVMAEHGFLSRLFRRKTIEERFSLAHKRWVANVDEVTKENAAREAGYDRVVNTFANAKIKFETEKQRDNDALEDMKARYEDGEASTVEEYCDLVFGASEYPDYFPHSWVLEYREQARVVVVDYDLPAPGQLPTIESYRYVQSRDEVVEKRFSDAARKKLYDSVVYQLCIRSIHELFEADVTAAIDVVAFNGVVTDINAATGTQESKMILSVTAGKEEFLTFNLSQIDPKRTFKHLKGVAATALSDLAPIPPVMSIERSDKRFVEGRAVVAHLDDSVNLAAMDWEDFEHLIRELFEEEFAVGGGEVKVTQASADGGVDAIAFDPDPIRGGKICIQAKRYTNVVGVAAVRDLYGTVMNEGATKGILVTTSDYGKDSYEFAKGKPITLLNGGNLLSLLEKHGHRARINIAEAKLMRDK